MDASLPRLSRRTLGAALLATLLLAPGARAAVVRFPLRLAYVRLGKDGFLQIGSDEQSVWRGMQARLGGLVSDIEPIQPGGLFGAKAPELDGGASCALAARKLASDRGLDCVILYATSDGRRSYNYGDNWLARGFSTLRSNVGAHDRATGEAYLLDASGGLPLASASADARQKEILNPFDDYRKPERETLLQLTADLERQLQIMAAPAIIADASIANR